MNVPIRLLLAGATLISACALPAARSTAAQGPTVPAPVLSSPSCEVPFNVLRFAISPDGLDLAMVDDYGRLVLLRLGERPRVLPNVDGETVYRKLQFSPDGKVLFVSTPQRQLALSLETLGVLNATTGELTETVAFSREFRTMVTVTKRHRGYNHLRGILGVLLSGSEYGGAAGLRSPEVTVDRIDLPSGSRFRLFRKNRDVRQILIDASGNRVVVLKEGIPNVLVFDGTKSKPSHSLRVIPAPSRLALTPDGCTLTYADWRTKQIVALDLASGREVQRYSVPGTVEFLYLVECSGDGSRLLGGTAMSLLVWDASSGRLLVKIVYPSDARLEAMAISSNGKVVAIPTKDEVLLYDVPDLEQLAPQLRCDVSVPLIQNRER